MAGEGGRMRAPLRSFALSGLGYSVRAIFLVACLDQVFRIFPHQAAALA